MSRAGTLARTVRTRAVSMLRTEGISAMRRLPIEPTVVLYESFAGNGMLCNPEAVYRQLREDPRYAHLRHVWVLDDPAEHPAVLDELAGDDRVSVVTRRSAAYFRHLSTAGYLVNNATFPAEFGKRVGQVYVNTWHGTPIKAMGYDIPDGGPAARNIVRNFLQADYLVSSSPFMTEQLYATAYKMRGILPGRVIEEGYPRIDRQFSDRAAARALLARTCTVGTGRVALLAPTWRGRSFEDPIDDSEQIGADARRLAQRLGPDWTVLVKVHQAVHRAARRRPELAGTLVDNDLPTNVVLAATDALVADYSSIVVDFLALDRPIVLLARDQVDYAVTRGLYRPAPGWPGPVHTDIDAVADTVAAVGTAGHDDPEVSHGAARREWRDRLCPREDGSATARLVDVVFNGQTDGHTLVDLSEDGRTKVLIYIGALNPNGMTSSALNLLRAIDHAKVDVTAFHQHSDKPDQAGAIASIDPRVRSMARVGGIGGFAAEQVIRQVVQRRGVPARRGSPPLNGLFADEWRRCFGEARFDHVVDFIGYGAFWDLLLLQAPGARRSIWLHNDMVADSRREVGGRQPLRRSLEAVFSIYRFFDSLVSVSPALAEVNRRRLARYAPVPRFTSAVNTIDAEGVRRRAAQRPEGGFVLPPADGVTTFVASGRLSSAKNFPRLVSAFAQVHAEYPNTRLAILGDGPDRAELEALVARLGLGGAVLLAGHVANPFPTVAASDCLVMSSDHEGQPMVILEALVLGLPVVSTDFDSVGSALPAGQGLVVPRSVDGVAQGLRAFLRGEVPVPTFDPEAYNAGALRQFLAAIGVPTDPSTDIPSAPDPLR